MLLEEKKAWKRLDMKSRRKIKIAHYEDGQRMEDMLGKEDNGKLKTWTERSREDSRSEETWNMCKVI